MKSDTMIRVESEIEGEEDEGVLNCAIKVGGANGIKNIKKEEGR